MKIVAIIPARGGSQRIPGKNIKEFCGKPLIAWTILEALKSKYLDKVLVSTDDNKIAAVSKEFGAEVPFIRPTELSGPAIGIEPILRHGYEWLRDNDDYKADILLLLMPTAPLRQTQHIDEAIENFLKSKVDSVVGVNQVPASHTPYWTLVKNEAGKVTLFDGSHLKDRIVRSQDFPKKCYCWNDLVYVFKPENLYTLKPNLYGEVVEFYETSPLYEMDINTPEDWKEAEI